MSDVIRTLSPQEAYEWLRDGKIDGIDSELSHKIMTYVDELENQLYDLDNDNSVRNDMVEELRDEIGGLIETIKELEDEVWILREQVDEGQ